MKDSIEIAGKHYVSSSRAAEISKYSKDYIGQLCRGKKIEARMMGRTWYVCQESLLAHKVASDAAQEARYREYGQKTQAAVEEKKVIEAEQITPPEALVWNYGAAEETVAAPAPIDTAALAQSAVEVKYIADERPLLPELAKTISAHELQLPTVKSPLLSNLRSIAVTTAAVVVVGVGSVYAMHPEEFKGSVMKVAGEIATALTLATSNIAETAAIGDVLNSIAFIFKSIFSGSSGAGSEVATETEFVPGEPVAYASYPYYTGPTQVISTTTARAIVARESAKLAAESIPASPAPAVTRVTAETSAVRGITFAEVDARIEAALANFSQWQPTYTFISTQSSSDAQTSGHAISQTTSSLITGGSANFNGSTLTVTGNATIGGNASVGGSLTVNGGAFSVALGVPINLNVGSNLLLSVNDSGVMVATTTPSVAAIFATSTTATSTFAGGIAVEDTGFVYNHSTNRVGIGTAAPKSALHVITGGPSIGIRLAQNETDGSSKLGVVAVDHYTYNEEPLGLIYGDSDATTSFVRIGGGRSVINAATAISFFTAENTTTTTGTERLRVSATGGLSLGYVTTDPGAGSFIASGNVGVGTSSPFGTLSVNAAAGATSFIIGSSTATHFIVSALGNVGIGTTSPSDALSVNGRLLINGTTTISANDAGITFTGTGVHDITAVQGTLRIGSNTIIGNIQAVDETVDIGTPAVRFDKIYANEINASNVVGTIVGGNINAETVSINFDNATADTENSYLAFERGSVTPNAVFSWNSDGAAKRFEFNQPVFIQNASGSTTLTTFDLKGVASQTADLLRIQNSAGTNLLNFSAGGNLGVGTTSPWGQLSVNPNALGSNVPEFVVGSSTATHLLVDGGGNVGIGTLSPLALLGVQTTAAGTPTVLSLTTTQVNSNPGVGLAFGSGANISLGSRVIANRTGGSGQMDIALETNGTTRLYVGATTGNVGIGTTTPFGRLAITGAGATSATNALVVANSNNVTGLAVNNAGSVIIGNAGVVSANLGDLEVFDSTNDGYATSIVRAGDVIAFMSVYSPLGLAYGGSLSNHAYSLYTNAAKRLEIGNTGNFDFNAGQMYLQQSTGNLGVGTTSPSARLSITTSAYSSRVLSMNVENDPSYSLSINSVAPPVGGIVRWEFDQVNNGTYYNDVLVLDRGSIGIGTSTPRTLLTLQKTAISQIEGGVAQDSTLLLTRDAFSQGAQAIEFGFDTNKSGSRIISNIVGGGGADLFFQTAAGSVSPYYSKLTIKRDGNIGISTTSPLARLDVASAPGGTAPLFQLSSVNGSYATTTRVLVDSSGNFGIGTASPNAKLSISNNISSGSIDNFSEYQILMYDNSTASASYGLGIENSTMWFNAGDGGFRFYSAGSTVPFLIDTNGRIGIGTTSPIARLSVRSMGPSDQDLAQTWSYSGSEALYNLKLKQTVTSSVVRWTFDQMNNGTTYSDVWTMDRGNVGIGTTSPGQKLSVAGDILGNRIIGSNFTATSSSATSTFIGGATFATGGGNVGIGTAVPGKKLQINDTSTGALTYPLKVVNMGNTSGTAVGVLFTVDDDLASVRGKGAIVYERDSQGWNRGDFHFLQNTLADATNPTLANAVMTIKNGGNVGIGITSPGYKLDVVGNASTSLDSYFHGVRVGLGANNITSNTVVSATGGTAFTSASNNNTAVGYNALLSTAAAEYNTAIGAGALRLNTTGRGNTAIGAEALAANTTAGGNTAIGLSALQALTSGGSTVAIGQNAFGSATSGAGGVAIGYYAASTVTTGQANVAIGYQTMLLATEGSFNTAVGYRNLILLTTGNNNTVLGRAAANNLTTGSNNVMLGSYAGTYATTQSGELFIDNQDRSTRAGDIAGALLYGTFSATPASQTLTLNASTSIAQNINVHGTGNNYFRGNVGIGTTSPYAALSVVGSIKADNFFTSTGSGSRSTSIGLNANQNFTGTSNTLVGYSSGTGLTTGSNNTILGTEAGGGLTTGGGNVFIGQVAGLLNNGNTNVIIGKSAGASAGTGSANTMVGGFAGQQNTDGSNNTFLGSSAGLLNSTGSSNIYIGVATGRGNTTGSSNIGIGNDALRIGTTSVQNTAIGTQALYNAIDVSASNNTVIGHDVAYSTTYGGYNTVMGVSALHRNTTGSFNTALGVNALYYNSAATNTVAIGYTAGQGTGLYSSQGSVIVGHSAGQRFATGSDYNTLLGYYAGGNITTGANNIVIGADPATTNSNLTTGSQNVSIGHAISLPSATASGQLNIQNIIYGTGNTGTGSTLSTGNIGIGTTSPGAKLAVNNTGTGYSFIVSDDTDPDSTPFIIDASGNVSIGTTTRGAKLTVTGADAVFSGADRAVLYVGGKGGFGDASGVTFEANPQLSGFNNLPMYGLTVRNAPVILAGETIPTWMQIYSKASTKIGTGVATDAYGLYVETPALGTNNYAAYFQGNVGVGTTSPSAKFAVTGSGTGTGRAFAVANSSNIEKLQLLDNGRLFLGSTLDSGYGNLNVNYAASGANYWDTTTASFTDTSALAADTGGGIMLSGYYTSAGVVGAFGGIQSRRATAAESNATAHLDIWTRGGDIRFRTDGSRSSTALMTIASAGNVGIGTTTPNSLLSLANTGTRQLLITDTNAATDDKHMYIESADGALRFGELSDSLATVVERIRFDNVSGTAGTTSIRILDQDNSSAGFRVGYREGVGDTFFENLYDSADGDFTFRTRVTGTPVNALTIKGSGNVGIGTANPSAKLHVDGGQVRLSPSTSGTSLTVISPATGGPALRFGSPDGVTEEFGIGPMDGSNTLVRLFVTGSRMILTPRATMNPILRLYPYTSDDGDNSKQAFSVTNTLESDHYFTVTAGGRVGTGTSTPWGKLSVTNTGTNPSFVVEDAASPDSTPFIVDASGNVGIGTTSPAAKLSVNNTGSGPSFIVSDDTDPDSSPFMIDASGNTGIGMVADSTKKLSVAGDTRWSWPGGGSTRTLDVYFSDSFNAGMRVVDPTRQLEIFNNSGEANNGHIVLLPSSNGGKVGIGTTSPWAKLSVAGTSAATGPVFAISTSTASATTTALLVNSSGFVGIGVNNPQNPLDIRVPSGSGLSSDKGLRIGEGPDNVAGGPQSLLLGINTPTGYGYIQSTYQGAAEYRTLQINPNGGRVHINGLATTTPISFEVNGVTMLRGTNAVTKLGFNSNGADYSTFHTYIGSIADNGGWSTGVAMTFNTTRTGGDISGSTGTERMRISSDGKIGIGTTSPWGQLSVNPNGIGSGIPEFVVGSSTATHFIVDGGGLVGIGSSSPTYNLDVQGTAGNPISNANINISYANSSAYRIGMQRVLLKDPNGIWVGNLEESNALRLVAGAQTRAIIDTSGRVGIGTTTPVSTLSVQGSLCVRDTGSCGTTAGTIYATTAAVTDIDVAENYVSSDNTLEAGEIVTLDSIGTAMVKRASGTAKPLGIISTRPGVLLGKEIAGSKPVALAGRVPLKINNEGGAVSVGDRISLSSVAGVGKKATNSGETVGIALESFSGTSGTIEVFVDLRYETHTSEFAIDPTGNIGMGTTTPGYKLHVMGDIAATSFVNISTRDSKTNISYLDKAAKDSILNKIKGLNVAQYRYESESSTNPLRLGLIAEEAPVEVLAAGGKGVDVYKLSTFILAGVQEQQKKIDTLELTVSSTTKATADSTITIFDLVGLSEEQGKRIAEIQNAIAALAGRVDTLASTTATLAADVASIQTQLGSLKNNSSDSSTLFDSIAAWTFKKLSTKIAYIERVEAKTVVTETLTIQPENSLASGVTITDRTTGAPACMYVADGAIRVQPGVCGTATTTPIGSTLAAAAGGTTIVPTQGFDITDQSTGSVWCVTVKNGEWSKVPWACGTPASAVTAATQSTQPVTTPITTQSTANVIQENQPAAQNAFTTASTTATTTATTAPVITTPAETATSTATTTVIVTTPVSDVGNTTATSTEPVAADPAPAAVSVETASSTPVITVITETTPVVESATSTATSTQNQVQ